MVGCMSLNETADRRPLVMSCVLAVFFLCQLSSYIPQPLVHVRREWQRSWELAGVPDPNLLALG